MGGVAWVVSHQDIRLDFHFGRILRPVIAVEETTQVQSLTSNPTVRNVSQLVSQTPTKTVAPPAEKTTLPPVEKRDKQEAYIHRYAAIAQREMRRYGIPASIKLAQGLLESDTGESPLATRNNNHFGIKCFSRSCQQGHCSNFSDDSHKDFFRIYANPAASYRAHSEFLQRDRYRHLAELGQHDYRSWAHGLRKAGYATDPKYAEKLITLIEQLRLYRFDEL